MNSATARYQVAVFILAQYVASPFGSAILLTLIKNFSEIRGKFGETIKISVSMSHIAASTSHALLT